MKPIGISKNAAVTAKLVGVLNVLVLRKWSPLFYLAEDLIELLIALHVVSFHQGHTGGLPVGSIVCETYPLLLGTFLNEGTKTINAFEGVAVLRELSILVRVLLTHLGGLVPLRRYHVCRRHSSVGWTWLPVIERRSYLPHVQFASSHVNYTFDLCRIHCHPLCCRDRFDLKRPRLGSKRHFIIIRYYSLGNDLQCALLLIVTEYRLCTCHNGIVL